MHPASPERSSDGRSHSVGPKGSGALQCAIAVALAVAVTVAFVAAAFRRAAIPTNLKPRQKTSVFKSGVAFLGALRPFFSLCPLR
jgi:hypothetical protein